MATPSIITRSNGGKGRSAVTFERNTRPYASPIGSVSASPRVTAAMICSEASDTEIITCSLSVGHVPDKLPGGFRVTRLDTP